MISDNNRLLKNAGFSWEERKKMRFWQDARVKSAINKKFQQRIHVITAHKIEDWCHDVDGYMRVKKQRAPYGWYITKNGAGGYRAMSVDVDGVFEAKFSKYSDAIAWLRGWKPV